MEPEALEQLIRLAESPLPVSALLGHMHFEQDIVIKRAFEAKHPLQ